MKTERVERKADKLNTNTVIKLSKQTIVIYSLTMTTLRVDDPGFEFRQGYGVFSKMSRKTLGPIQPPTQWYLGSFQRVTRPGSEGDHSSLPGAEIKN